MKKNIAIVVLFALVLLLLIRSVKLQRSMDVLYYNQMQIVNYLQLEKSGGDIQIQTEDPENVTYAK